MTKLSQKPKGKLAVAAPARFQRFHLTENPFPAEPVVNKDAVDPRINGSIYEVEIRSIEYKKVLDRFLVQPQDDLNHIRLGYIIDTSYVGRGNGKSAFLVNLQQEINKDFCLDISEGVNKCFALYVTPQIGGRTKTFSKFIDCLFDSLLQSHIIKTSLAVLRLEALTEFPKLNENIEGLDDSQIVEKLNDEDWIRSLEVDTRDLNEKILGSEYLQALPPEFPLFRGARSLIDTFVTEKDFAEYYSVSIKKPEEKLDFVFSHLVSMFLAAGFNGAYVLVDNFEQIAIPQSTKQKLDFAFELRSCLYDGSYLSSRLGFFNFFLTFHVGVQRLIGEAWAASGMENRSPISSPTTTNHIIQFEKLSADHVALLLKRYLEVYRVPGSNVDALYPFKMDAIRLIGQMSEFNASNILRTAFGLLERLADTPGQEYIDSEFVASNVETRTEDFEKPVSTLDTEDTVDLESKTKQ
jgi:hypothetical protein